MAEKINLIYQLDGKNLDQGLDVNKVINLLVSMDQLIQESNKILNPASPDIEIKIKPLKKGSYIFDIVLDFMQTSQATISPLGSEGLRQIFETLKTIGIISGESFSVIKLLKSLKGGPKNIIESQDGNYNYISENNSQFSVNGDVHNLIQNPTIQTTINNAFTCPFNDTRVNKIESYIKDQEEETKNVVTQKEAKEIIKFVPPEPHSIEPTSLEERISLIIHPKRADVEGDGKKWSFREAGGNIFSANVKDENFLEDVRSGKIRLSQSDILEVTLLKKQTVTEDNNIKTTNDILKVNKYHKKKNQKPKGPKQSSFLDDL
jgi:hypothetical protein